MFKTVSLDDFQEGMELGAPVKNKFGQIIFPQNLILEEKHKKIMQTWGITEFKVMNPPGQSTGIKSKSIIDHPVLKGRLNWTPKNNYEENLLEMVIQRSISK